MNNSSELELIEQCKDGNVEAFEQLISSYQKKVFNLAYRMMGNAADAEDVAQEAFVRVFRSIESFNGESSFSTWLYKVTSNLCLDALRKRKRQGNTFSIHQYNSDDEEYELPVEDETPSPYEQAQQSEAMRALKAAIDQLSDEHKAVVVLRDLEGFTYEEIAKITNSSLGTVKSRINRARLLLRKMLEKDKELFL